MPTRSQKEMRTGTASVVSIKDWSQENARGREEAIGLIALMAQNEAPYLLGYRVMQIMEKDSFGGFEAGFFHQISVRLMR